MNVLVNNIPQIGENTTEENQIVVREAITQWQVKSYFSDETCHTRIFVHGIGDKVGFRAI